MRQARSHPTGEISAGFCHMWNPACVDAAISAEPSVKLRLTLIRLSPRCPNSRVGATWSGTCADRRDVSTPDQGKQGGERMERVKENNKKTRTEGSPEPRQTGRRLPSVSMQTQCDGSVLSDWFVLFGASGTPALGERCSGVTRGWEMQSSCCSTSSCTQSWITAAWEFRQQEGVFGKLKRCSVRWRAGGPCR